MRPDEDIRKDILNALLQDPATDSYPVQVSVHDAMVMLTGSVGTFGEKKLVERIAKGIKGVSEIHNNVTIAYLASRTSAEMAGDITDRLQWDIWLNGDRLAVTMKDGAATLTGTVGTVREFWRAFEDAWVDGVTAVDISALKVDPAERDEGRRKMAFAIKSDGEIKKAVLATFHQDPRLKGSAPEVIVEDGEVFLRGSVGNMKAKSSAEQDARNTVGVGSIESLLKVKPKEHLSDPDIAAKLKSALFADPLLGDYSIVVAVVNHVAVLSGTVDSRFQKAEAQDVATRTKGVTMISNRLKIQPEFSSIYAEPLNSDPYPYLITEIYDATPFLSDDQLRVHIEHGLSWCPDVGWGEVKVSVANGIVTLGGTLRTWLGRNEADRVALQCGARSVINHIDVEKGGWWW
jgi:osmotically-inducible protein OsmY